MAGLLCVVLVLLSASVKCFTEGNSTVTHPVGNTVNTTGPGTTNITADTTNSIVTADTTDAIVTAVNNNVGTTESVGVTTDTTVIVGASNAIGTTEYSNGVDITIDTTTDVGSVVHTTSKVPVAGTGELPPGWDQFCSVDGFNAELKSTVGDDVKNINCYITASTSGLWNFEELRNWIGNSSNSNSKFAFGIKCEPSASISMPWPVKAVNVVYIAVENCVVTDFYADFENDELQNIPDQLVVLEFRHVQVLVKFRDALPVLINVQNTSKDFDCGHEDTLERFVFSNVSYTFSMEGMDKAFMQDPELASEQLNSIGDGIIEAPRHFNHRCEYKHLRHIDESISNSQSQYHMQLLTANSFFPELRVYNLSRTGVNKMIREVREWSFYFPKLEEFDLSHNAIRKFDLKHPGLTRKRQHTKFNLQYNNISVITKQDVQLMNEIPSITVDMRNNPISCSCTQEMTELLSAANGDASTTGTDIAGYIGNLTCATPTEMSGKRLNGLRKEDLPCGIDNTSENSALIGLVIVSIALVLLIGLVIATAKYRIEIRMLMYTRFNILLPCQPKESKFDGKIFDAFVSYSSADEDWVADVFQKLESGSSGNTHIFKFCLHHRDFIPGKTIFNNVIDCVESSRHTVILLSKSFVKSEYCLYEFREAFQQSIIEQKRHLVIIVMEDIPEEDMPNDLRRCLKTFTYIQKDDGLFHDRLVYALAEKPEKKKSKSKNIGTERSISAMSDVSTKTDMSLCSMSSDAFTSTESAPPSESVSEQPRDTSVSVPIECPEDTNSPKTADSERFV